MYFFFILFFVSLTAIILMISRKLLLINNTEGHSINHQNELLISGILDFDKIKKSTIKNIKKTIHTLIWVTLRTYIVSINFINKKRKEIVIKIKNKFRKHHHEIDEAEEKKEVSKYIKIISEYRQKIRTIKNKIREEEGIE